MPVTPVMDGHELRSVPEVPDGDGSKDGRLFDYATLWSQDHAGRLGGHVITDSGLEAWKTVRNDVMGALGWTTSLVAHRDAFTSTYQVGAVPPAEFPLCYTYDVYRRG